MADKRLEEIRTSDMTESAVNVELIEWLKKNGTMLLFIALVVVLAFKAYIWWGERRDAAKDEAWSGLNTTDSPRALMEHAQRHKDVDALFELSMLQAAQRYHQDLLRNESLTLAGPTPETSPDGAETPNAPHPMTAEERERILGEMEQIFLQVIEATADEEGRINWQKPLQLEAMFGLAAVAEMRGDAAKAQEWYAEVEREARDRFPALADLALEWRESADSLPERTNYLTTREWQDILSPPRQQPMTQPATQPESDQAATAPSGAEAPATQPEAAPTAPAENPPPVTAPDAADLPASDGGAAGSGG